MAESDMNASEASEFSPRGFLARDWPYVVMLTLAVIGVAVASVAGGTMMAYWEILVPVFAAVCVWTRARETHPKPQLRRLVTVEALHWGAVFVAMQLAYVPDVKSMMNADASALMVLTLLALGTFTAGAQLGAWRICVVGVVLALGVPFIAWLDRATLLITIVAVAIAILATFIFVHHRQAGAQAES
jgi:asparagine N-glycosylation enzyme membrane subunit Stt3